MLPKEYRLNLAKNFRRIKKYARPIHTPYFTVLINRRPRVTASPEEQTKIGFVMSTKVGKATERNRAKRVLSEALRPHILKIPSGLELVFILRPSAPSASLEKIQREVEKVLNQLKGA